MQKQASPKAQTTTVIEREPINLDIVITATCSIRTNVRTNLDAEQWADAIRQALRGK